MEGTLKKRLETTLTRRKQQTNKEPSRIPVLATKIVSTKRSQPSSSISIRSNVSRIDPTKNMRKKAMVKSIRISSNYIHPMTLAS